MTEQIDARIQKSQAAIILAGMQLLSRNSEASLSDIAREAGVGRTTVYRLYDTKEQLIKAIAIHCSEAFDTATAHLESEATSALHAFELMFKAILPLAAEMEFLMRLGDLEDDDPEIFAIYRRQMMDIAALVEYAKAEGSLRQDVSTDWVVNLIEGLFYAAWLTNREKSEDPEVQADLVFQTFCNGVAR